MLDPNLDLDSSALDALGPGPRESAPHLSVNGVILHAIRP